MEIRKPLEDNEKRMLSIVSCRMRKARFGWLERKFFEVPRHIQMEEQGLYKGRVQNFSKSQNSPTKFIEEVLESI